MRRTTLSALLATSLSSAFRVTINNMDSQTNDNKTYLTAEGKKKLQDELAYLQDVKKLELAERLRVAISQGDLSENADYIATKEEYGFVEGRVQELERMLRNSALLDEKAQTTGRVRLGGKVTVKEEGFDDEETFLLVGRAEANPAHGKISNESPLGAALVGKKKGDKVTVAAPGGQTVFRVVKVE